MISFMTTMASSASPECLHNGLPCVAIQRSLTKARTIQDECRPSYTKNERSFGSLSGHCKKPTAMGSRKRTKAYVQTHLSVSEASIGRVGRNTRSDDCLASSTFQGTVESFVASFRHQDVNQYQASRWHTSTHTSTSSMKLNP